MSLSPKNEAKLKKLWLSNSLKVKIPRGDVANFLTKLDESDDGCWLWTASKKGKSGQFIYYPTTGKRKTQFVHRIVFQLKKRRILSRSS